ncbi:oligosaccharide flippase family protein [Acinetobacter pseudolwoffii]|uniref:oligosaccharide flippase family protein n=1 Tax=Acinetobacter pseudolwoffii TaxID=2053287 RepID=UPI0025785BFD|nr:oligosaccharide flippase family protein [Acinetobacter pseudolwoffii]MDM1324942.1 oligosaccharide flippase family protein [Acinetobacter pseudolwoffii]
MKSLLDKVNAKLNAQGGFLKAVSVLVGGTAFAQLLAILVLPILTRVYSPEEFASFAVYSSILNILIVISCLRFEIAIPLPKDDETAFFLFILALLSNIFITTLIVLLIFFFQDPFLNFIQQPQLKAFIWFIPIGVFFAGLYTALQYWNTRKRNFNVIAKTRLKQSVGSSLVQVGGGFGGLSTVGLILGHLMKFSVGTMSLFITLRADIKYLLRKVTISKLKESWKKYDKFPKYSSFEALANSAAIQLPVIIIAAVAVGPEAGYLMLSMQVMAMPMSLIGGAIGQVYLAHAPEYYDKGELKQYTVQTIKQISKIALFPLLMIGISAPFIFPLVFGTAWANAGHMLLWMTPWFIMQILSSPVSMSLHITGSQKIALSLQILGLLIRVGGLLLISINYSELAFDYYAISGFIFYFIYFLVILYVLRKH